MRIGVSTQIFWDYKKLDYARIIPHVINDMKFEGVEITCQDPLYRGWGTKQADETKKEIRDVLDTLNRVTVSIHAPYHDLNIAALNVGVEKEVIKQLKEAIDVAGYLNSEIVVVHPGYVASRKYPKENAYSNMIRNFREISSFAQDQKINICMENLASKQKAMGVHIPEIKKIIGDVDRENFKLCLDVAHVNTTGIPPTHFLEELREYVGHVHISDNTGDNHHLPLGMGNIDFEGFLRNLSPYDGLVIVEGWIPRNQDHFLRWDREKLDEIMSRLEG